MAFDSMSDITDITHGFKQLCRSTLLLHAYMHTINTYMHTATYEESHCQLLDVVIRVLALPLHDNLTRQYELAICVRDLHTSGRRYTLCVESMDWYTCMLESEKNEGLHVVLGIYILHIQTHLNTEVTAIYMHK